jgi:hypothetical protein
VPRPSGENAVGIAAFVAAAGLHFVYRHRLLSADHRPVHQRLPRRCPWFILVAMKKLSIAVALLSLSIAAPVFACPESHKEIKTAEKAKETKDTAKADKAKDAKTADKAKPADKVSQR